jgi:dissimilatory sulfite reductase (desulfoviridin) alpha/beta subunit
MPKPEIRRLVRKLLTLILLIAGLAVMNSDRAVRKVTATACCDNCNQGWVDCVNWAPNAGGQWWIYSYCLPRYNACKNSCSPPCS